MKCKETRINTMREVLRSTVSKPMKLGLHVVAFWPGTPFAIMRWFLFMLSTSLLLIGQVTYVVTNFYTSNLEKLLDCMSLIVSYNLMIAKLIIAWVYRGVLWNILTSMEEDCVKYAGIDMRKAIPKAAVYSERLTAMVIVYYSVSSSLYTSGIMMTPRINNTRNLVLLVTVPFDMYESPNYELLLTAQIIHLLLIGYSFGVFTALLLMMIIHTGCHVDVLCDIITNISSSKDEEKFRFVIRRYQEIILFSDQVEKIFTYISLAQLLANTVVSCCLGYIGLRSLQGKTNLPQLVKASFAYIAVCIELFTYCFAGEYLNVKSDTIVDAAYQISWYNLQPCVSRQVILLLLRSQKGLRLTFGKFSNLSLETFTWIMKTSASYMSVFLAMS